MPRIRIDRLSRPLVSALAVLALSAIGPAPVAAATPTKPTTPAAASSGAGKIALPAGSSACRTTAAKPSSPTASCPVVDAHRAPDSGKVALPGGATPCASTLAKPSSGAAACSTAITSPAATQAAFNLSLVASPAVLAPGGTTTLTASTDKDVGPTPFFIEIFDLKFGVNVAICGVGTSCSVAVSHDQADLTYVAYVSQFGTALPPPGIVATSNVVEVIWLSVSLNAAPAVMAPGDTTTLLALSALDLSNTRFSIEILDVSADVAVAVCGFDNACWTTVTQSQSTAHTYRALITSVGAGPSIVAASPDFAVSWLTVGLSASPTAPVAPPFTTTLTATATLDVGPTPWNIEIFDLTTSRLVTACGGGQVCTIDVALTDADVHTYVAFVASFGALPPTDIRAMSNAQFVNRLA